MRAKLTGNEDHKGLPCYDERASTGKVPGNRGKETVREIEMRGQERYHLSERGVSVVCREE
jgi:hypothetical protein